MVPHHEISAGIDTSPADIELVVSDDRRNYVDPQ
jgi:hypothetical protein